MSRSASEFLDRNRFSGAIVVVFVLVFGIFILRDNHHPRRVDVLAFVSSGVFYWLVLLSAAWWLGFL